MGRDAVGEHRFLEEPDEEDGEADRNVVPPHAVGFGSGELRHHLGVVQDRPRDQVRKVGDEERVVHEVVLAHLALRCVGQVSDLREGIERDAQRQDDLREGPARAEGVVEVVDEKVGVLEITQ